MNQSVKSTGFILLLLLLFATSGAQPITGYWKGKINGKRAEVKIIKNGDSITGTSYYYNSPNSYRRYSIRGYFDDTDNSVVWWDDELIAEKNMQGLLKSPAATPYLSVADFNCPGGTKMYLEGNAALKEDEDKIKGPVELEKTTTSIFKDEWNFVIDNYTFGANDPGIIDSVAKIAFNKPILKADAIQPHPEKKPALAVIKKPTPAPTKQEPVKATAQKTAPIIKDPASARPAPVISLPAPAPTIEEKFTARSKLILKEIPVQGDSIELRFYDNAEVDGDSISIFLNNRLLYEHIRLTEKAYIIKLAVSSLQETNELIMVAENLGSIPPNTAYMVCLVGAERYETRLESTEQSSAGIRFLRIKGNNE